MCLQLFQQWRGGSRRHYWALEGDHNPAGWTAETQSTWLLEAMQACDIAVPPVVTWTSHSLRKGAASAAYAIKVRLNDIRYAGGWSIKSTVLESKYVDFTMRQTKVALLFFGYLKKDSPA